MEMIQNFDNVLLHKLNNYAQINPFVTKISVFIAQNFIYLIPIGLVILWFLPNLLSSHKDKKEMRKDLLFITATSVISWQIISKIISLFWQRPRPFTSLIDAKELIFHRPTYSFPSDHALFLFAISFGFFALGYKKMGWITTILASVVSIARIAVAVHWPTDIIAGIIIAYLAICLAIYFKKIIEKIIINPLYWLAQQIKLT